MFLVSSVDKSDCIEISGELESVALLFAASKIGSSYSHSHDLANQSSSSRLTSGSGFHFCAVIRMSVGLDGM